MNKKAEIKKLKETLARDTAKLQARIDGLVKDTDVALLAIEKTGGQPPRAVRRHDRRVP
jgi:hypothetical protein